MIGFKADIRANNRAKIGETFFSLTADIKIDTTLLSIEDDSIFKIRDRRTCHPIFRVERSISRQNSIKSKED